jgi:hypothetical protein
MQGSIIPLQTGWGQEQIKYQQLPISLLLPFLLISIICRRFHLSFLIFVTTDMMYAAPLNNSVLQFDRWIQNNLDGYKQWCINNNSLLIVTYDEDDFSSTNKIATVFYGAHVAPATYAQTINHYNVLRTIEDANGLTTHAGCSCQFINY